MKVELFNPSSSNSCPVEDLQYGYGRYSHTSCSSLICGGGNSSITLRSCEKINGTEVSPFFSITLREGRYRHLCWPLSGKKILLIGGFLSPTTTEIVLGSSSSGSFYLPYKTELVFLPLKVIIITKNTLL